MSSKPRLGSAVLRLQQDYLNLNKEPVPYITAEPLPEDMLEWHYCIQGPEDTPYFGGYYHGRLVFPAQYPFKPPSIYMITPNGRFEVNRRLCLSISDYHPDQWNPAWCVSTILTGLLSFMLEETPALGTIETSASKKIDYARKSLLFNVKNETFESLFEDVVKEIKGKLANMSDDEQTSLTQVTSVPVDDSNDSNIVFIISFCIIGLIAYHFFENVSFE